MEHQGNHAAVNNPAIERGMALKITINLDIILAESYD